MTWNPRTWNKAIMKRVLFAAVLFPPVIGFSNSPKHERPKSAPAKIQIQKLVNRSY